MDDREKGRGQSLNTRAIVNTDMEYIFSKEGHAEHRTGGEVEVMNRSERGDLVRTWATCRLGVEVKPGISS